LKSCDLSTITAILRCDMYDSQRMEIGDSKHFFSMPWWGSNKIYRTPKKITEIQLLSANLQYVL
jgi:hypothetical protein